MATQATRYMSWATPCSMRISLAGGRGGACQGRQRAQWFPSLTLASDAGRIWMRAVHGSSFSPHCLVPTLLLPDTRPQVDRQARATHRAAHPLDSPPSLFILSASHAARPQLEYTSAAMMYITVMYVP